MLLRTIYKTAFYSLSRNEETLHVLDFTLTAKPLQSVPKDAAVGQVLGTVLVLVSLM